MRVSRRRCAALVLVLVVGDGWRIGPTCRRPPAPVRAGWLQADHEPVDSTRQEYRDWWTVFDDPVLTRLIETAYHQNLTLLAAGVRVLQARAALGVAIGELYPQEQQV